MKYIILTLSITVLSQNLKAQNMVDSNFHIEGMTIAITNMEQMLDFYSSTFNVEFSEQEINEFKLYSGTWGGLKLLFCPAKLAGNTASQNRHQFDIVVPDLDRIVKLTTENGGKTIGSITEDEYSRSIGVYDPDQNSIMFKQLK